MKKVVISSVLAACTAFAASAGIIDALKAVKKNKAHNAEIEKGQVSTNSVPNSESTIVNGLQIQLRNLFAAIIKANCERGSFGLDPIWPKSNGITNIASDNDIAEMSFNSAHEYFNVLFDIANFENKENWAPYIGVIHPTSVLYPSLTQGGGNLQITDKTVWCSILANTADSMDDATPLMISANLDCAKLPQSWDGVTMGDAVLPLCTRENNINSLLGKNGVVVLYKGGVCKYIKAQDLTLNNLFLRKGYQNLKYLLP